MFSASILSPRLESQSSVFIFISYYKDIKLFFAKVIETDQDSKVKESITRNSSCLHENGADPFVLPGTTIFLKVDFSLTVGAGAMGDVKVIFDFYLILEPQFIKPLPSYSNTA